MFLTSLFIANAIVLQAGSPEAAPQERPVSALIEELGSRKFTIRQKATRELKARGRSAVAELQAALNSDQPEIRSRAKSILAFVLGTSARKRFLSEANLAQAQKVPGWQRLRSICVSDAEAINVLKNWLKAEPGLFESQIIGGRTFSTELKQRIDRLSDFLQDSPDKKNTKTVLNSVQAILFLVTEPDVRFERSTMSACESLFELRPTGRALVAKDRITQTLTGSWLQSKTVSQYHKLTLTLRFGLQEGLTIAEAIVRSRARGRRMEYALHCIGKLGGPKQIELLESQLKNNVRLSTRRVSTIVGPDGKRTPSTYEYRVSDIALAMLWHLHKENPGDHGFTKRVRPNGLFVYAIGSLGFDSNEQREVAFAEWERFAATRQSVDR